jgi:ADP-heptose:LPS heptosyltransferase
MQRLTIDNINNGFLLIVNKVLILLQNFVIESIRLILFSRKTRDLGPQKENILVVKTGGLGDFLFGVPAFKLLRNTRPEDKVVLLTQIAFGGIHLRNLRVKGLLQIPWIELVEEMFEATHIIGNLSVETIVRLRKDLKLHTFDRVILMPGPGEPFLSTLKKLLLLKLLGLGSCEVYGIRQNYSLGYLRRFHVRWSLAVHKIYGPWQAVEAFLSKKHDLTDEYLKLDSRERFSKEDASALLQRELRSIEDYVVLSPGSSAEWKSWGQTNFKSLIENLAPVLNKQNIAILLAGPLHDAVLAKNLKLAPNVFDICGRYSIPELATIHQHSLCSVAVDGGAAHLAAFSGATVISLSNGGEEPGIVTPVGANVIEHRNLTDCTPCFGMTLCPLGHSKCIIDIPVQEVFDSVMAVVASR